MQTWNNGKGDKEIKDNGDGRDKKRDGVPMMRTRHAPVISAAGRNFACIVVQNISHPEDGRETTGSNPKSFIPFISLTPTSPMKGVPG